MACGDTASDSQMKILRLRSNNRSLSPPFPYGDSTLRTSGSSEPQCSPLQLFYVPGTLLSDSQISVHVLVIKKLKEIDTIISPILGMGKRRPRTFKPQDTEIVSGRTRIQTQATGSTVDAPNTKQTLLPHPEKQQNLLVNLRDPTAIRTLEFSDFNASDERQLKTKSNKKATS